MYGAGLIGTGGIFVEHWRAYANLDDRVRVVGAADIDEAKLRQASERCFVPLTFTDHRELLARDDVDIVSICTPPKFHEHHLSRLKHKKK